MQAFKALRLLDTDRTTLRTWPELLLSRIDAASSSSFTSTTASLTTGSDICPLLAAALTAEGSVRDVRAAVQAMQWLGVTDLARPLPLDAATPLDALCILMERRLQYGDTERDMVVSLIDAARGKGVGRNHEQLLFAI